MKKDVILYKQDIDYVSNLEKTLSKNKEYAVIKFGKNNY